ncbi:hypothetical protein HPB49_004693 [Dermacentor silvarum]|uniref:Uncharacterized protein n=1 Tax=Dermacentor silvarum TaxID=543639 RepID=A0ACB8DUY4_DERSI|nr:hypothetical protein HPB49_004693 [Dermacentor silvarum]
MASKTADEAASAAAAEADACGDDAGNQQYGDPWDTDPAAVALRLLRAEDNRKSPTPAHATPAAKGAPSTNEVARQPVYEAVFDLRLKQREPDQGLDRMAQSPVPLIPGLQQQPLASPLHPVPSSCSSSEVSLVPGHRGGITGQPSLRDACCPGPPPHQGSSGSISVSSSVQLQPAQHLVAPEAVAVGILQARFLLSEILIWRPGKLQRPLTRAIHYHVRLFPRTPLLHLSALSLLSVASMQVSRCSLQGAEQMSICFRYIFDGQLREEFFAFIQVTNLSGQSLASTILTALASKGVDVSYMCGQGYDGAANMAGHFNVVQASSSLDLAAALMYVDYVESAVLQKRESGFNDIFDASVKAAEASHVEMRMPRVTSRQLHRHNVPVASVEERFRLSVFLPFLDYLISQLNERFKRHRHTLKMFSFLLPQSIPEATTIPIAEEFEALY